MSESKHTPGPWRAVRLGRGLSYDRWEIVEDEYDDDPHRIIAEVPGRPPIDGDECGANARLIAAAPELLEALKEAERMVRNCPGNWQVQTHQKIRAAIAKATGGDK